MAKSKFIGTLIDPSAREGSGGGFLTSAEYVWDLTYEPAFIKPDRDNFLTAPIPIETIKTDAE